MGDGDELNSGEGCNGDEFYYQLDNGTWTSQYYDVNGVLQPTIDVFYATGNQSKISKQILIRFQQPTK